MDTILRFVRDNWLILFVVGGLVVAWVLLRTPGAHLASTEEFDQRLGHGQPTVVEFYSNT